MHYRYFVAVGKRAPSHRKRAYFTAEFKSIYGDRARVLRPLLACISLLNKVPLKRFAVKVNYNYREDAVTCRGGPLRNKERIDGGGGSISVQTALDVWINVIGSRDETNVRAGLTLT